MKVLKRYHSIKSHLVKTAGSINFLEFVQDCLLIFFGVMSASFGLKSFLLPNNFIDGGITGTSLLLAQLSPLSLSVYLILLNIPFLFLGYLKVNRRLAVRTIFSIVFLAIVVANVRFPIVTSDNLLIAIFGGILLGLGIGLTVRGGAVLDGTEIMALYLNKKFRMSVGNSILGYNLVLFAIAAIFITIDKTLYSILIYVSASKTLDLILEGIEAYIGVTIVSNKSAEIKEMLITSLNKGVTVYFGKRGYIKGNTQGIELEILFTVVTRLEIGRVEKEIKQIDPAAFIVVHRIKDIRGGFVKKRVLEKTFSH